MLKVRRLACYWLPVFIWMTLIFSASGDTHSYQHSSRILGPLLRWLFPHIQAPTVDALVFAARKGAHLTEYAILALLLLRALRKPARPPGPWSWRTSAHAVLIVMLYAATDEFHQLFVPSRDASVRDVLIDTAGGICGMLAWWAGGRRRKWW